MAYYLDLFDGDPATTGASVLAAITGSSTRTNVTSQLATIFPDGGPLVREPTLTNPSRIRISSSSVYRTNVSYVALYDSPTGGTLLRKSPIGTMQLTIGQGNVVQFEALALSFNVLTALAVALRASVALTANLQDIHGNLAAALASTAALHADLYVLRKFQASLTSTASLGAALKISRNLQSALASTAALSAALHITRPLAASLASTGSLSAALHITRPLATTLTSTAVLVANLTTIGLAGQWDFTNANQSDQLLTSGLF